mmetsp:Transcript_11162/g.21946  ORF Transcript_11162/g.21946 Transcript_11162/m.21946 type:complete len:308 (-) Transcript_11162:3667-4590(-)
MIFNILAFASIASACNPSLFCYWESWTLDQSNFASDLSGVPANNATSHGCDVILIAFNDWTIFKDSLNRNVFGFVNEQVQVNATDYGFEQLQNDINKLKSYGAQVWLSVGGTSFSTNGTITTNAQAQAFADALGLTLVSLGLTGVDFSQMDPGSSGPILEKIIKRLKNNFPAIKIMYTIPALGSFFDPWKTVLTNVINKIDYVQNLYYDYYWLGYNLATDLANLGTLVPDSKVVIGIMPGCHDAISEPLTTVADAITVADLTVDEGYAGVAIWSANRDTTSRTGLEGCVYATGLPSATYINAVQAEI